MGAAARPSPSWGKPASPSAASPIALGMGGVQREYAAMGSKGVLEPDRGLPSDQPGEVHSEFITPVGPADDCREAGDTRAPRVLPGGAGHGHVGHTAAQRRRSGLDAAAASWTRLPSIQYPPARAAATVPRGASRRPRNTWLVLGGDPATWKPRRQRGRWQ